MEEKTLKLDTIEDLIKQGADIEKALPLIIKNNLLEDIFEPKDIFSLLMDEIEKGSIDIVKNLFPKVKYKDEETKNCLGVHLLYRAISKISKENEKNSNYLEIAKYLIENGANIKKQLLHLIIKKDLSEIIEYLIKKNKFNYNREQRKRYLEIAIESDSTNIIKCFFENMKIDSKLIETCLKKAYSQRQEQPEKSFSCIEYIKSIRKKLKINKKLVLKLKNKDFNGAKELIKEGADIEKALPLIIKNNLLEDIFKPEDIFLLLVNKIEKGSIDIVKNLFPKVKYENKETKNGLGVHLLYRAISKISKENEKNSNYLEIAKYLIENGANIEEIIIHLIIKKDLSEIIEYLIKKNKFNYNREQRKRYLEIAIESDSTNIIKCFFENMKIDSELIETCLKKAYSQQKKLKKSFSCIEYIESIKKLRINEKLVLKLKNKDFNGAKELIKEGADVNAVINNYEETLLLWAIRNNELEIVIFLLTIEGIDVNKSDYYGTTPLTSAAENGNLAIIEEIINYFLKKQEVDVDQIYKCLYIAAEIGHEHILKYFFDEHNVGIEQIDYLLEIAEESKLAEKNKSQETIKYLKSKKKYLNEINLDLISATKSKKFDDVKKLITVYKANINIEDIFGMTPLLLAIKNGGLDIIKFLLNTKGIDVNESDRNGTTPLLLAIENDRLDIVELLLNTEGIDVNKSDRKGTTPLLLAVKNGYSKVVKIIVEYLKKKLDKININQYLEIASKYPYTDIMNYLFDEFKKNTNKDAVILEANKCLKIAAKNGNSKILKYLFETHEINKDLIKDCLIKATEEYLLLIKEKRPKAEIFWKTIEVIAEYLKQNFKMGQKINECLEIIDRYLEATKEEWDINIIKYFFEKIIEPFDEMEITLEQSKKCLEIATKKEYVNIVEYLIDTIQFNPNQIDRCLDIEFEKIKLNPNIFFYLYDEYSKNHLLPLLPKIDFPLPEPLPEEASFTKLPLETPQITLYTNTNVLPSSETFETENKSEINKIEEKINPAEIKDDKDKQKKEEKTREEEYISTTKIHSHSSLSNPKIKSVETSTLENNGKSTNKTTIYQTQKFKEKEKVNTQQKGETRIDVKSRIAHYNSLAQN